MSRRTHRYPLEDITVLDLTRLLPGAYCTLILADLGATVIKIEDIEGGDYVRWMPPHVKDMGVHFLSLNRNKKSMKLNLKSQEGKEIFRRLIKGGDVLVEGFRPGVMDRLGLGYRSLRKINPRLIFCSISGYGQDGPYREKAGHDINYLGISGALGSTGSPEGPPVVPSFQLADVGGGSFAPAVAILAALIQRMATQKGQSIDASMMEGALSYMTMHFGAVMTCGARFHRGKEPLSGGVICYNVYKTKDDRYMSLGALEPKFWKQFCALIGREDLVQEQFSPAARDNPAWIALQDIFRMKSRDEWREFFTGRDVCCEPIYDLHEVPSDPHVQSRKVFFSISHPTEGTISQVRTPFRLSNMARSREAPPPSYGEHTKEILKKLGYSMKTIKDLEDEGVI